MKKRIGDAFMSPDAYGRSLPRGVGINLLVPEIEPMAAFLREVLSANVLYADPDFAALVIEGSPVMLHADHAYLDHELHGVVAGIEARGAGVEIRSLWLRPGPGGSGGAGDGRGDSVRVHGQAAWTARVPYCRPVRLCLRAKRDDCAIVSLKFA